MRPELPFVPGSECAGVVRRPRPAVPSGRDRVAALPVLGGFAEAVAVPEAMVFPLPDRVSFAAGAALPMNYLTVQFALDRRARLERGEVVLVHGAAGGIGTAAIQIARAMDARVIAVVSSADKVETARAAGAHHVVLADGFLAAAKELTDGRWRRRRRRPGGRRPLHRQPAQPRARGPAARHRLHGRPDPRGQGQPPAAGQPQRRRRRLGRVLAAPTRLPAGPSGRRCCRSSSSGLLDPPIGSRHPLDDVAGALAEIDERRARGKVTLTDPVRPRLGRMPSSSRRAAHLPPPGARHRRRLRPRARPRAGPRSPAATRCWRPTCRPSGPTRCRRRRHTSRLDVRSDDDVGGGAGPRARDVGRARPARQQRRGRRRRAHRRRDDAGVALDRRHQPARRRARLPHLHARSSRSRAAATSSTPPRSPGSCTRRGWRPTTRSRPASSRSARPCRTSWHRTGSTSRSCAPSFFRTNLGASFQGADTEMEEAGKRMVSGSRRTRRPGGGRSCVRGIDARRDVILTDREGHLAWRAKRFVRPAYTAVMKRAAAKRLGA